MLVNLHRDLAKRLWSSKMITRFLPISIDSCHESIIECLIIEGIMLEDFGPWSRGTAITLTFNFEDGTVTSYDDNGNIINQVRIKLKVVV